MRPLSLALAAACAASAAAQAPLYRIPGDSPGDEHGFALRWAGDVDLDGRPDFVVGAYKDDATGADAGSAYLYSGQTGGVIHTWHGAVAGEWFGHSVSGGGNVDSDAVPDVLVGSRLGVTSSGTVRVYSGATGALHFAKNGDGALDGFGYSADFCGDVNGDGVDDFIVGAPFDDNAGADSGMARVISGAPVLGGTIWTFDGDASADYQGFSVAAAGDVDNDGWPDLIVGAPGHDAAGSDAGRARVYSGRTGAILHTFLGDAPGDELGFSVDGAGDVDLDGYADLIAGARYDDSGHSDAGMARVYSGRSGAVLHTFDGGPGTFYFGHSVAGAGDVDLDGQADLAVGTYWGPPFGYGNVKVFSGASGAVLHDLGAWDYASSQFGHTVDGGMDVNGDLKADLLVGARSEDGLYSGAARLILLAAPKASVYCGAKLNSLGCTPAVATSGAASLAVGDNFVLTATNVLNQKSGIFFWGSAAASIPFGGGTLCVAPPVVRTPVQLAGGTPPPANDCTGSYSYSFSQAYMGANALGAGTTVYSQFWSRDPAFPPPDNVGLTQGISFVVLP